MSVPSELRVLVVDDEKLIADAHAEFVGRVPGFVVDAIAYDGATALRRVRESAPDLVLLDFHLPDVHGLDICRSLRGAGTPIDVIAVTSTRDLAAVRTAVSLGVVSYLLKPFTFAALRDKLERYADFRRRLTVDGTAAQGEIDRAFASLRGYDRGSLPPGLSEETLDAVARAARTAGRCSASEVAAACSVSRVTARRYLEHLADVSLLERGQRYHGSGRPEIEYRWARPD